MIKLSKEVSDGLRKIHPKKLTKKVETAEGKKIRKKNSWKTRSKYERIPEKDTFVPSSSNTKQTKTKTNETRRKAKVGDFLINKNKVLAENYKNDLDIIAQTIPEMTFIREFNDTSAKELKSILDKLEKRSEQFEERGFRGIIRDAVRARVFMPDADKNYMKIVEAMKKKGYKVAMNFAEDAEGNAIKNPDGSFKMIEDIDIRFGKNARKSGYEDVQIRFQKGDVLYELIILPGPNYLTTANKEHEVFENIKKYSNFGLDKDMGAKQIISALGDVFARFSKRLYADALLRDKGGSKKITEPTTFTKEEIKDINALFKSLKNLFLGKFNTLPPSKRTKSDFKETKTFINLNTLETNLKKFIDMYKPIEEASV